LPAACRPRARVEIQAAARLWPGQGYGNARARLVFTNHHVAGKDMCVGGFRIFRRKSYIVFGWTRFGIFGTGAWAGHGRALLPWKGERPRLEAHVMRCV
jgi:hypothetical protein